MNIGGTKAVSFISERQELIKVEIQQPTKDKRACKDIADVYFNVEVKVCNIGGAKAVSFLSEKPELIRAAKVREVVDYFSLFVAVAAASVGRRAREPARRAALLRRDRILSHLKAAVVDLFETDSCDLDECCRSWAA